MFILKKGHQPGVYVPLRALFLVFFVQVNFIQAIAFDIGETSRHGTTVKTLEACTQVLP